MAEISSNLSDEASDAGSNPLQHQAVQAARDAFASLNNGNLIFQQCLQSTEPISTVVQTLLAKHGSQSSKRYVRILEGFQKHTIWLHNMAPAIDVAVNASSGIACPVWAPIKYILKLSKDRSDALEHILRMIETISDCLPRLRIYEKLNKHPSLQTAFLQLFTSIINFSVITLRYLKRNVFARTIRHVGRDFESEFGNVIDRLRRHARAVDEMAVATEIEQAAQHRQKTEKVYHQDLQIRCSEWLRPSNVREVHTRQLDERLAGTCQWILETPEFSAWNSSSTSEHRSVQNQLLLVCGNPGCGKSVLASALVEYDESRKKDVIFFPFSNVDKTRESIKDLVRSLIWQALVATDEKECWEILHRLMSQGPVIESDLWDALANILRHGQKPWIVIIDGVDECKDMDGLLRDRIPGLMQSNKQLRGLILGRPQIVQHRATLPSSYLLEIIPKMVKEDIKLYVSESVNSSPLLRDHASKALMMKILRNQSEGMFLWVRLMIQDLQSSSSAAEARQRLHCLPKSLAETYKRVLRHLHDSLGKDCLKISLVRNVLTFTTMSRHPLSFQELRYALALDARLSSNQPSQPLESFMHHYSPEELITMCANLIVIANEKILPIHVSLKEFLSELSNFPQAEANTQLLDFCEGSEDAHRTLAKASLEYLQLKDYGLPWQYTSSLSEIQIENPFLEYSSKHILFHISASGEPCPSLMDNVIDFLKSRFCVSWIEHFFLDMANDEALVTVLGDFDEFVAWSLSSGREHELRLEMRNSLTKELQKRLRLSGADDSSTQRWYLFTEFAKDFIGTESLATTAQPQIRQPSVIFRMPVADPSATQSPAVSVDRLARQMTILLDHGHLAIDNLPHTQLDMILRVRNLVNVARELTDTLELLFRLLLRKVDCIPVYALFVIAAFYFRVGQDQKGLHVVHCALEKVEGSDTGLEFQLLKFIWDFHLDRQQYHQAVPYLVRHITGITRQRGCVDTDVAHIKIKLGSALNWIDRLIESEVVFQELFDLERSSQFLKKDQLHCIHRWMGYCRYDVGDVEGAISWIQKALDLPNAMQVPKVYDDIGYLGCLLYNSGRYCEALDLFENTTEIQKQAQLSGRGRCCVVSYYQGLTLHELKRWDEAFGHLQQALIESDKNDDNEVLPPKSGGPTKSDIAKAMYGLGFQFLRTYNYPRSMECYQLATSVWATSRDVDRSWPLSCTLYAAASCYGLKDVKQGMQLLRGMETEFLSYYGDNFDELLEFKYLLGFGTVQLKSSLPFVAKTKSSSPELPASGLKRQGSLDNVRQARNSTSTDYEWRYMLNFEEYSRDNFKDLF